jgi:hypothetical protein
MTKPFKWTYEGYSLVGAWCAAFPVERVLPMTERVQGSHEVPKVDAMAHRHLCKGILFIDSARTAAADVGLSQYVSHARVESDGFGNLQARVSDNAT